MHVEFIDSRDPRIAAHVGPRRLMNSRAKTAIWPKRYRSCTSTGVQRSLFVPSRPQHMTDPVTRNAQD